MIPSSMTDSAFYCVFQCNNPLTKEAKLTAAMRIIDEWKDYDAEIKQLSLEQAHEEEELVSASADSSSPESGK